MICERITIISKSEDLVSEHKLQFRIEHASATAINAPVLGYKCIAIRNPDGELFNHGDYR
jgi:hypothetical protein